MSHCPNDDVFSTFIHDFFYFRVRVAFEAKKSAGTIPIVERVHMRSASRTSYDDPPGGDRTGSAAPAAY